jgi:hypothetical protein
VIDCKQISFSKSNFATDNELWRGLAEIPRKPNDCITYPNLDPPRLRALLAEPFCPDKIGPKISRVRLCEPIKPRFKRGKRPEISVRGAAGVPQEIEIPRRKRYIIHTCPQTQKPFVARSNICKGRDYTLNHEIRIFACFDGGVCCWPVYNFLVHRLSPIGSAALRCITPLSPCFVDGVAILCNALFIE